jgi:hypothetical protein
MPVSIGRWPIELRIEIGDWHTREDDLGEISR